MRTFFRLLVLVLGLTAATSVFYAVQQQKAVRLARSAAESLEKERTELRNKLWEAERRRNELEARMRGNGAGDSTLTVQTETGEFVVPAVEGPRNGPPEPRGFGRALAAFDSPEAQRLLALQQKGALDANYADLFRRLNLTPAQLEEFKDLLVEKRTAVADVLAAARSQGLTGRDSRDEIRALVQDTQAEVDDHIRALLGDSGYQQYQNYERTQPQRAVTNTLEQRLSYTGTPLTPQQTDQLVQILAANASTGRQAQPASFTAINLGGGMRTGFVSGGSGAAITDQALQQAAGVLSPAQLDALRQIQAEQQAEAQLSQLMRNQFPPRRTGGQSGATSTAPSASSATPPKG